MIKTFRPSKDEQELLKKLSRKINTIRLNQGRDVMKESEILHYLIALASDKVAVSENGDLYLKEE